jgi:hypothetical protein
MDITHERRSDRQTKESITVQGSYIPMIQTNRNANFWVEVKHRRPLPKKYTWEIYRKGVCLSVEESRGGFGSWEEASQVGNMALRQFLQAS